MIHVEWHEYIFKRRHRRAFTNVVFAETIQRRGAHLHHLSEFVNHACTVIPKMSDRTRCTRDACILIREIDQPARERIMQNLIERGLLVSARRKILIAVGNCHFIPFADPFCIRVGNIRQAIRAQFHERSGIIHDRRATGGARRKVVLQSERMTHFVRC